MAKTCGRTKKIGRRVLSALVATSLVSGAAVAVEESAASAYAVEAGAEAGHAEPVQALPPENATFRFVDPTTEKDNVGHRGTEVVFDRTQAIFSGYGEQEAPGWFDNNAQRIGTARVYFEAKNGAGEITTSIDANSWRAGQIRDRSVLDMDNVKDLALILSLEAETDEYQSGYQLFHLDKLKDAKLQFTAGEEFYPREIVDAAHASGIDPDNLLFFTGLDPEKYNIAALAHWTQGIQLKEQHPNFDWSQLKGIGFANGVLPKGKSFNLRLPLDISAVKPGMGVGVAEGSWNNAALIAERADWNTFTRFGAQRVNLYPARAERTGDGVEKLDTALPYRVRVVEYTKDDNGYSNTLLEAPDALKAAVPEVQPEHLRVNNLGHAEFDRYQEAISGTFYNSGIYYVDTYPLRQAVNHLGYTTRFDGYAAGKLADAYSFTSGGIQSNAFDTPNNDVPIPCASIPEGQTVPEEVAPIWVSFVQMLGAQDFSIPQGYAGYDQWQGVSKVMKRGGPEDNYAAVPTTREAAGLTVDTSKVDINTPGQYPVVYAYPAEGVYITATATVVGTPEPDVPLDYGTNIIDVQPGTEKTVEPNAAPAPEATVTKESGPDWVTVDPTHGTVTANPRATEPAGRHDVVVVTTSPDGEPQRTRLTVIVTPVEVEQQTTPLDYGTNIVEVAPAEVKSLTPETPPVKGTKVKVDSGVDWVVVDEDTGEITITTPSDQPKGRHEVVVVAQSPEGQPQKTRLTILVNPEETPKQNAPLDYGANIVDIDAGAQKVLEPLTPPVETATVTMQSGPDWVKVDPATGEITATPPAGTAAGRYPVEIVAQSPEGQPHLSRVTFVVPEPEPEAPVQEVPLDYGTTGVTVIAGGARILAPQRGLVSGATAHKTEGPDWVSVGGDGTVTMNPPADTTPGSYSVVVTAQSPEGEPQQTTMTVNVTPLPVPQPEGSSISDKCLATGLGVGVPLLALIPLGLASTIHIPGLDALQAQISQQIQNVNTQLQQDLGIFSPQLASWVTQLNASLNSPQVQQTLGAAGMIAYGLLAGGLLLANCLPEDGEQSTI